MLRQNYATHLLESGNYLHDIKELIGHNNSKTNEIYTHVFKKFTTIKSPFDDL